MAAQIAMSRMPMANRSRFMYYSLGGGSSEHALNTGLPDTGSGTENRVGTLPVLQHISENDPDDDKDEEIHDATH